MRVVKRRRITERGRTSRSLASASGFEAFVLDQLSDLDDVLARKMFGGTGLYARGLFFGIVARDVLYLKADSTNLRMFLDAGCQPFRPYPDRPGTMKYYSVPLEILESAPELIRWATSAVAAAERASTRQK
jgi:DNA transformation protein